MTSPTGTRRPVPADLFGGRLKDSFLLDLTVAAVADLTPWLRSITFESSDLVDFAWVPGQDLMFEVPTADGTATRRRYTIRRSDPSAGTLDIEVVLHGDGSFARWAGVAAPGATISAIGPRGVVTLRAGATHHLLVGDETAIPFTAALLAALPPDGSATALVAADGDTGPLAHSHPGITWLPSADLLPRLRSLKVPAGAAAYLNGERSLVREAAQVVADLGVAADAVAAKPYWRRDQANAGHGEPGRD